MNEAVTVVSVAGREIGGEALALIAGPCVLEEPAVAQVTAARLRDITGELGIPFIFKASFDKANRTSVTSYRGPGLERGLEILAQIKETVGVPVLSDVHEPSQVAAAAQVLDMLQIPAFLCRQTDLLVAAGESGRPVNIKKGQFLAPDDMLHGIEKVRSTGNEAITVCERGSSFGYHNLVVDMRGLVIMRGLGCPVVFDATHSVQLPGGGRRKSSGERQFVAPLARAAVAAGADALFAEVHPDPDRARCDGPNMLPLDEVGPLLRTLLEVSGMPGLNEAAVLESARRTFEIESCAVSALADRLGPGFVEAVRLLVSLRGCVVVSGVGKSGAIGRKIGGTLASTGTPAVFMHPVEAVHGDLGIVGPNDVALLLSNSGETDEVVRLLPVLKRRKTPIIAIVGNTDSTLGAQAEVALDARVAAEACPLGLAPTASTAAQAAMGDALAMAAMESRGYSVDDYAEHHPAGSLGRRMLLRVGDIMHAGDANPVVPLDSTVLDAVLKMTSATVRGVVSIVDTSGKLKGLFTDGDFRLLMHREPDRNAVMARPISSVMTLRPTSVAPHCSAAEAANIMQEREFDNLPVVDDQGCAVGVVDIQDIIRAGIV